MRLVTFRRWSLGPATVGVLVADSVLPADRLLVRAGHDPAPARTLVDFLQLDAATRGRVAEASRKGDAAADLGVAVDSVELLAPIPRPSKIIGLGYNYRALCENEGVTPGPEPELFTKLPTSVTGPFDPVKVPRVISKVDFETELGVVIGRPCRDVGVAEALSFVGGYTVVNDVTAKIIPRPPEAGSVVLALKGPDTFAPMGPCLLTADEAPDPQAFHLTCRVNGVQKQDFRSSDMVHTVAEVVAYLSERFTLEPGDVITTGTSLGIGIVQKPPVFLEDGDVVECEISGIGTIRNAFDIPALRA